MSNGATLLRRSQPLSSLFAALPRLLAAGTPGFQQRRLSKQPDNPQSITHFGYQDVAEEQKANLVADVFSRVAASYDVMNDLMSLGLHHLWKDRLVSKLALFPGTQLLDVAGGTGDVAFRALDRLRAVEQEAAQKLEDHASVFTAGTVTVCDINHQMLAEGKKRAAEAYPGEAGLSFVQGDAEALPFASSSVDAYTIAFGIRNVTRIDKALQEAHRVLRPGGLFMCLEFSKVQVAGLMELYDLYSFNIIPQIGRLVANDEAAYQYLVESIRTFPDQESFAGMIEDAGLKGVDYENLNGGIVAIHSGFKL